MHSMKHDNVEAARREDKNGKGCGVVINVYY